MPFLLIIHFKVFDALDPLQQLPCDVMVCVKGFRDDLVFLVADPVINRVQFPFTILRFGDVLGFVVVLQGEVRLVMQCRHL